MTVRHRIARHLEHDAFLIGGLVVALLVLFVEPVQRLFVVVRDLELSTGKAFMPALVVLFAAMMLHQQRKRHAALLDGQAVAATLQATDERARDLERLVAFGHATADALDVYALRDATQSHLASISGGRDAWVLLHAPQVGWRELAQASATGRTYSVDELTRIAGAAIAQGGERSADSLESWVRPVEGHACVPMMVGGHPVGVFGVWTDGQQLPIGAQQRLTAAAALLAIGVKNVDLVHEIREHSLRDGLTGCCNRAHALDTLQVELRRADRSGGAVTIIMLDLDHFKQINDGHGHLAGDAVLSHVGQILRHSLRASDLKARYGGEEFLIVLPGTSLSSARRVAESLRQTLAQTPLAFGAIAINVTASLGLTAAAPGELEATALIARADSALYAAKRQGRNCVRVVAPPLGNAASDTSNGTDLEHHTVRRSERRADVQSEAGIG